MKFDDNIPIYLQIIDECKRRIITDEYQPGMKVPPVRELAVEFGVNPNTVQRAMQELERDGLFISERTNGRYICKDPERIMVLKKHVMNEKIDLFLDEMKEFGSSEEEIIQMIRERYENGKADWLHYDVMDGHFVPNISFGYSILKDVSKVTSLFLDVHLMISEPQKYVDEFIKSGANLIVFHIEAMENKEDTLALIHHIKENNVQVGISIKPNTPVDAIQDYLSLLDVVLVMSVEPGFGGQSFKEIALDKIKDLATRRKENSAHYLIEVDGGINATTGKQCKDAGVDVLVAGSYVFNSDDYTQRITSLK